MQGEGRERWRSTACAVQVVGADFYVTLPLIVDPARPRAYRLSVFRTDDDNDRARVRDQCPHGPLPAREKGGGSGGSSTSSLTAWAIPCFATRAMRPQMRLVAEAMVASSQLASAGPVSVTLTVLDMPEFVAAPTSLLALTSWPVRGRVGARSFRGGSAHAELTKSGIALFGLALSWA